MRRYPSNTPSSTVPSVTGAGCLVKDMIKENDSEASVEGTRPTSPATEQMIGDHPSSANKHIRRGNTWSNVIKLSPQELINDDANVSSNGKERQSVKLTERIVVLLKRIQVDPSVFK